MVMVDDLLLPTDPMLWSQMHLVHFLLVVVSVMMLVEEILVGMAMATAMKVPWVLLVQVGRHCSSVMILNSKSIEMAELMVHYFRLLLLVVEHLVDSIHYRIARPIIIQTNKDDRHEMYNDESLMNVWRYLLSHFSKYFQT
jgi:hypothetical protein